MAAKKQKQQKPKKQPITKKAKILSNKAEELGLKPASEITKVDDLQFELGRLRTLLESFQYELTYKDKELDRVFKFNLIIDPMNRTVAAIRTE